MGPVYYLSGRNNATPEALRALGLGYLLEDAGGLSSSPVPHSGPDGRGGVVFSLPPPEGEEVPLSYLVSAVRTWQPLPGTEGAWFGWNPAARPGPADVARRAQQSGHLVRLGDGADWLVPVARCLDGSTRFPAVLEWDGRHWARGSILERYRELFAAACRIWDALGILRPAGEDAPGGEVSLDEQAGAGARALAINYRIGPGEISLLGLFPDPVLAEVLKALVDWPAFRELAADGSRRALVAAWARGNLPDHQPTVPEVAVAAGAGRGPARS